MVKQESSAPIYCINKTKEMGVDFRRTRTATKPINIIGGEVGIVEHYKYLGVYLNKRQKLLVS